jgi:beta-lactamase superfamily II metal-dependent hydrolase
MLDQYKQNMAEFNTDVLLVAHHGAKNGISDKLLETISPDIAVITMGDDQSAGLIGYHHPRQKELSVL